MSIFFVQETATTVEYHDGSVFITQFDGDDCESQVGQVVLTRRQFEEMFNHSKKLFKDAE